jgi:hypothetical protein
MHLNLRQRLPRLNTHTHTHTHTHTGILIHTYQHSPATPPHVWTYTRTRIRNTQTDLHIVALACAYSILSAHTAYCLNIQYIACTHTHTHTHTHAQHANRPTHTLTLAAFLPPRQSHLPPALPGLASWMRTLPLPRTPASRISQGHRRCACLRVRLSVYLCAWLQMWAFVRGMIMDGQSHLYIDF